MSLERSIKGKKAKAVFFRQFNDLDIYIEDKSKAAQKLYAVLFSRAFAGKCRIETVFPLGDKLTVIKQCSEDQADRDRLSLYIVDGDLDLLNDNNPHGIDRLFVLNRYCIENYLVDEQAIISVLNEEDLHKQVTEIASEFNFQNWVESNEEKLFGLFILYAIVKVVRPEFATVAFPVRKLVSSDQGIVDSDKITERISEVQQSILEIIDPEQLKERKESVVNMTSNYPGGKLRFVSGKDYLIPLILMRMRRTTKLRADNEVIKQRLAMKCDVAELAIAYNCIA